MLISKGRSLEGQSCSATLRQSWSLTHCWRRWLHLRLRLVGTALKQCSPWPPDNSVFLPKSFVHTHFLKASLCNSTILYPIASRKLSNSPSGYPPGNTSFLSLIPPHCKHCIPGFTQFQYSHRSKRWMKNTVLHNMEKTELFSWGWGGSLCWSDDINVF